MTEPFQPFLQRCVSVDLEVDPATATIFAFAAVRDDARPPILAKKRDLMAALDRLEAESAEAEHLLATTSFGMTCLIWLRHGQS
jgi:ATP-dependent DNA helicase RecQ